MEVTRLKPRAEPNSQGSRSASNLAMHGMARRTWRMHTSLVTVGLLIAGTAMAVMGFGCHAMAKRRTPAWGLAGFLGLPGLLFLAILKGRSGDPWNT